MSEAPGTKTSNGTAVGVATVVAGVAGTLASSLFASKESRQQRAQREVEERLALIEAQTSQAMEQLVKIVDGLNLNAAGNSGRTKRAVDDLGKSARRVVGKSTAATRRQVTELDREAIRLQSIERANQLGHDGSRRARELARTLNDRTAELITINRSELPEWRLRTSQSASEAVGKGSALLQQAIDSAPDVRGKVSASTSGAVSKSSAAAHQVLDRAPDVVDTVTKSIGNAAHQGAKLAANVREDAPGAVDKVSRAAQDVLDQARNHAPDVRERAHDIAVDASHRAHRLADEARTHAPDIGAQLATVLHSARDTAKPVLEDVSTTASRLIDEVKEASSQASESLIPEVQHRVDAVAARAKSQGQASAASLAALGATAGDKLAHTSGAVEQQSKAVVNAAGQGTKDTGSLVLWSVAAAGVVYFAFLNDEQRDKAKESGKRIVAEIKEVYRDVRGYDEEFT